MKRTLLPGIPYPLGATVDKKGTNFAIFSEKATLVELCLFDAEGRETDCIPLRERTALVWHGFVRNVTDEVLHLDGGLRQGRWSTARAGRP